MFNLRKFIILIGIICIVIIIVGLFALKAETAKQEKLINAIASNKITDTQKPEYRIVKDSVIVPIDEKANKKIILLTIDDGPSAHSIEMMNTLIKNDVKAIFFINGIHNKKYPTIIETLSKNGFPIGNHTWSHLNLVKEKDATIVENQIDDETALIEKLTGKHPRFFRAPYGLINQDLRQKINERKMTYIDWSASVKDWLPDSKKKEIFIKHALDDIHSGSIVLVHEYLWSSEYLDELIQILKEKGYSFADPNKIKDTDFTQKQSPINLTD